MQVSSARRLWLAGYVAVTAANLVAAATASAVVGFVTVLLAMPLLLGFFTSVSVVRGRAFRWVVAALVFSWFGDWLGHELIGLGISVKLGMFLLAHLCYALAFWPLRRRRVRRHPGPLLVYALVIGSALVLIVPSTGNLAPAVIAYGGVLGAMAALSTAVNRTAAIGGALFVVSDLTIAVTVWVVRSPSALADLSIMSTYLTAQLLLVLGVTLRTRT